MNDHAVAHGAVLHLGDYRTALSHVACVDAVTTDTPHSAKTHSGHDAVQSNDGELLPALGSGRRSSSQLVDNAN